MKNTTIISMFTLFLSLSVGAHAKSYQELLCAVEMSWTHEANAIYKNTLKNRHVDNYSNIADFIEPLQNKSQKMVLKNCLAGKHHKEIQSELKKLWKEGCAKIVNPSLNEVCLNFMPLNDGSNVEDKLAESPELKELFKRASSTDSVAECSPEVSTGSIQKDSGSHHLKAIKVQNTAQ